MPEWILPATDLGVFAQAAAVALTWIVALAATWHRSRDVRVFVFGLGFLLLASIAARGFLH